MQAIALTTNGHVNTDAGQEQAQTWSSMAGNLGGDAAALLASEGGAVTVPLIIMNVD